MQICLRLYWDKLAMERSGKQFQLLGRNSFYWLVLFNPTNSREKWWTSENIIPYHSIISSGNHRMRTRVDATLHLPSPVCYSSSLFNLISSLPVAILRIPVVRSSIGFIDWSESRLSFSLVSHLSFNTYLWDLSICLPEVFLISSNSPLLAVTAVAIAANNFSIWTDHLTYLVRSSLPYSSNYEFTDNLIRSSWIRHRLVHYHDDSRC